MIVFLENKCYSDANLSWIYFIAAAMFVNDSIRIREQYCVTHLSAQPPPRKKFSTTDDIKGFAEYDQTLDKDKDKVGGQ